MTKLIFILSFLSVLNFHSKSYEKKSDQWEQLKDAAHKIGLCIYNTEETFCSEHKDEFSKREQAVNLEEEEVYYFEMKENWAKERVAGRVDFEKHAQENFLIFYDIQQGPFVFKDNSKAEISTRNFIMINLQDDFSFSQTTRTDGSLACVIESDKENKILENVHWREFMTHRSGRLSTKVSFAILNPKAKPNFDSFTKAFSSYQQSKK